MFLFVCLFVLPWAHFTAEIIKLKVNVHPINALHLKEVLHVLQLQKYIPAFIKTPERFLLFQVRVSAVKQAFNCLFYRMTAFHRRFEHFLKAQQEIKTTN